jgi:hypothetical protein
VTAGIAVDNWKLPVFERHLELAGLSIESRTGLADDSTLLLVPTNDPIGLQRIVAKAQRECKLSRRT